MTVAERSDAELLAAIGDGDRTAMETLYHRHARWLMIRLHRRCSQDDLVDTALQDTFIAVWRSARNYQPLTADARAWLWSIALRRLIDQLRKRKAPVPMDPSTLPEPEPLPPPGTRAYDLLVRLPADLHSVVQAVYVDGLTTAEAGVLLGIPQGTVKSRLARARPLLQESNR